MSYLALGSVFLIPPVLVALVAALLRRPRRSWWTATAITALVLVALTVVFDSIMIAVDLFRFDEDALTGVRLVLAPVEDLAWPLAAALLLPALWQLLGKDESGSRT
ncbi:lycopene cyclase domain-containing protein [Pseudactinotalea suaedae]|jgi:lycopene cyclase domain-containing protein|uniref:lycopene cyclase domain-containing protein n=1 Tax=Pseudactinotalea suaedae TaxID=1524924 RepID=UPI0012E160B2|nr:lycopene cyclase domain-containing protein [Pseudactinotalea suaedae]